MDGLVVNLNPLVVKAVKPANVPDPTVILFKDVTAGRVVIDPCVAVPTVPVKVVAETLDNPDKVPDPTVIPFKDVTDGKEVIDP